MVKFVLMIKLKMDNILLKTNLPVFYHSIIPYRWHEKNAIKRTVISIS